MPTAPAPAPYKIRPVRIACINKAKDDLGVPFDKLTAALQAFYDKCFLPVWGYPVQLYNTDKPAAGDWLFYYLDDADDKSLTNFAKSSSIRSSIFGPRRRTEPSMLTRLATRSRRTVSSSTAC
jgi:hypothetical protein